VPRMRLQNKCDDPLALCADGSSCTMSLRSDCR
jgi:hypothetical protein